MKSVKRFGRARKWAGLGAMLLALVLTGCGSVGKGPAGENSTVPHAAERREIKLGLALGGGAARGFAHLGVIQVLEEAGLRPSHVAGTSAGSSNFSGEADRR